MPGSRLKPILAVLVIFVGAFGCDGWLFGGLMIPDLPSELLPEDKRTVCGDQRDFSQQKVGDSLSLEIFPPTCEYAGTVLTLDENSIRKTDATWVTIIEKTNDQYCEIVDGHAIVGHSLTITAEAKDKASFRAAAGLFALERSVSPGGLRWAFARKGKNGLENLSSLNYAENGGPISATVIEMGVYFPVVEWTSGNPSGFTKGEDDFEKLGFDISEWGALDGNILNLGKRASGNWCEAKSDIDGNGEVDYILTKEASTDGTWVVVEIADIKASATVATVSTELNKNGEPIQQLISGVKDLFPYRQIQWLYSESGKVTEITGTTAHGNERTLQTFFYDHNEDLTQSIDYERGKALILEYQEDGYLKEATERPLDGEKKPGGLPLTSREFLTVTNQFVMTYHEYGTDRVAASGKPFLLIRAELSCWGHLKTEYIAETNLEKQYLSPVVRTATTVDGNIISKKSIGKDSVELLERNYFDSSGEITAAEDFTQSSARKVVFKYCD